MSRALAIAGLGLMLSACQMVGPDYHLPEKSAVQPHGFSRRIWRLDGKPCGLGAGAGATGGGCIRTRDWINWCSRPWRPTPICAWQRPILQRARAQVDEAEAAGGWSAGVKIGAQRLQESGRSVPAGRKKSRWPTSAISASVRRTNSTCSARCSAGSKRAKANADATQAAADTARITLGGGCGPRVHAGLCRQRGARNRPAFPRPAGSRAPRLTPAPARCRARR
jgi:hypothetical protein